MYELAKNFSECEVYERRRIKKFGHVMKMVKKKNLNHGTLFRIVFEVGGQDKSMFHTKIQKEYFERLLNGKFI